MTRAGRVAGKKALVTGGAQGLGAAIARMLAREGAQVAVSDLNGPGAAAIAAEINAERPGTAFAFTHDVTSEAQWNATLEGAVEAMGGLSILVNNAGIGAIGTIEDETLDNWRRVMAVDVESVFLGCKLAMPFLREAAPASIVNISSIAGIIASGNMVAYNTAKAAVLMMSKSVALHAAASAPGVRCNSVHPVFIKTPILDPFIAMFGEEGAIDKLARQIPMKRIGEPDDVAYAVLYLASDESKFVTASELKIDGGISAY